MKRRKNYKWYVMFTFENKVLTKRGKKNHKKRSVCIWRDHIDIQRTTIGRKKKFNNEASIEHFVERSALSRNK